MPEKLFVSVQTLQSAVKILFPIQETNDSLDRQVLIIGCLINRGKTNKKPRRECKGLHEKFDKNVFYEFDDKSLNDHSPIHVEHIDVAQVDKSINNTVEEIRITNENKTGLFQQLLDKYRISKTTTPIGEGHDVNPSARAENNSTVNIWSIGRFSKDQPSKNVLLTDLIKALETLETIVDGDGDQISFKPADIRSIIKSQKFSSKFLQFLNTIKNTYEQSNTN